MDKAAGLTSSVGKSLSETSSNISSKLPSLELMTDKEVSSRVNETIEQREKKRKIREKYTEYLDTIAGQIFHGYNAHRRGRFPFT